MRTGRATHGAGSRPTQGWLFSVPSTWLRAGSLAAGCRWRRQTARTLGPPNTCPRRRPRWLRGTAPGRMHRCRCSWRPPPLSGCPKQLNGSAGGGTTDSACGTARAAIRRSHASCWVSIPKRYTPRVPRSILSASLAPALHRRYSRCLPLFELSRYPLLYPFVGGVKIYQHSIYFPTA